MDRRKIYKFHKGFFLGGAGGWTLSEIFPREILFIIVMQLLVTLCTLQTQTSLCTSDSNSPQRITMISTSTLPEMIWLNQLVITSHFSWFVKIQALQRRIEKLAEILASLSYIHFASKKNWWLGEYHKGTEKQEVWVLLSCEPT